MASIATTCSSSSGLIFRSKDLTKNGGFMVQFNGLRPIESASHVAVSSGFSPNWSASTSGLTFFLFFSFFFLDKLFFVSL